MAIPAWRCSVLYQGKNDRQKAMAAVRSWKRPGNPGWYFRVLNCASENGLSSDTWGGRWDNDGERIESFTILTTAASRALADLHHRQPAIIEADDLGEWLEPSAPPERLLALARRAYDGPFDRWAVSRRVNHARNDDPDLLLPSNE